MRRMISVLSLVLCLLCVPAGAVEPAVPGQGVYDYAAVLTREELAPLEALAGEIEARQEISLAVVLIKTIGELSPEQYADDFYDSNGFGVGPSRDGMLLLVSFDTRDVQISTVGQALLLFSDADTDRILDSVAPRLSDGDYTAAAEAFFTLCDAHLTRVRAAGYGDTGETVILEGVEQPVVIAPNGERVVFDADGTPVRVAELSLRTRHGAGTLLLFALAAGIGVGALILGVMVLVHKTSLSRAPSAQSYLPSGGFRLNVSTDRFVRSHTARTAIPQSNDSGGGRGGGSFGGGSHRTASSGRTHGGTGRKF